MGLAHYGLGDIPKAIEFLDRQLTIVREIGDRRGEATALGNLACAYSVSGQASKVIELSDQQLTIAREIHDRKGEGNALWNSALALEMLGRRLEAIIRAETALRIYDEIKYPSVAPLRAHVAAMRRSI